MNEIQPAITLGIVGAGAMGLGIAQVAAAGGIDVIVYDVQPGSAVAGRDAIVQRLARRVASGKMAAAEADAVNARIQIAEKLDDLHVCQIVVEAIIEDLEAKRTLFSQLEKILPPDAILASNTSSLPIGTLAAGCHHKNRVAGLHFFNPVPLMKLVEVIPGPETADDVIQSLLALSIRMGRSPVVVKDMPGFLVNYGGRALATEGLAVVHETVATPAQVDAIMRDCHGFRMGPFELMDLTGIDVNYPVTQFIHESFFGDPRLRSTPLHRYMLTTGRLGRKTGQGFYDYPQNEDDSEVDFAPSGPAAEQAFIHGDDRGLGALLDAAGVRRLDSDDGRSPILIAPYGEDCSSYAARKGLDHRRLVAVDMLCDTSSRLTLMTAPCANREVLNAMASALARERKITLISDSPGFVGQRLVAMVANLGCEMAQTGVASVHDIDHAMRLGLNYPKGPLEMADSLGVSAVYQVLEWAQRLTGDDRYRPSQWLRRRAQLKLPASATDN